MTIKFNELIKIRDILSRISNNKFSIKISYEIAKFLRDTDGDAEFYAKKLNEIISLYKDPNLSDDKIQIMPDKIDECNKSLSELENCTVDVPKLHLDVEIIPDTEITPSDMYWLIPVLA